MIKFTKMEAFGNDYIYIDAIHNELENLKLLSKKLTNRHFGIGGDGLILICPSKNADFKMRIFNPDGTEAEMCGNALRSVGKYVYTHNLTSKKEFSIETLGGIKKIILEIKDNNVTNITAHIGSPIFNPKLIPVNTNAEKFILEKLEIADKTFLISALSWGNPHTVIFLDNPSDLKSLDINKYGPLIENHILFPKRTNVTFASVISKNKLTIREWERGTGETIGCATGCSSAVVIGYLLGYNEPNCEVNQIGGTISINYNPKINELSMTGNSNLVYEGTIDISKFLEEENI